LSDCVTVFGQALAILGLAIGLSTISYARYDAAERGTRLRNALDTPLCHATFGVALCLLGLGFGVSSRSLWERAVWTLAVLLCATQILAAWRLHRSASAIGTTSSQPPSCEDRQAWQDRLNTYVVALRLSDALATVLSLRLAEWLRQALAYGAPLEEGRGLLNLPVCLMAIVTWAVIFDRLSAYQSDRVYRFAKEVETVLSAVVLSALTFAGFLYLTYRGLSRLLFAYFFLANIGIVLTLRLAVRLTFKRFGLRRWAEKRVLIVGAGEIGRQLAALLYDREWMGLLVVGFVDDNPRKFGRSVAGLPVLGTLDQAPDIVERHGIDEVILTLPMSAHARMRELVSVLNSLPVEVGMVPDVFSLTYLNARSGILGDMPLVVLKEPVLDQRELLFKRVLDLTVTVIMLTCLWPLMLLIAVLVKLDSPGPAFFTQTRVGWHGKPFTIYKFRTMFSCVDGQLGTIVTRASNGKLYIHKDAHDPRVTRLGRHLRRWSLDELPQLLNVLKGEMSLVGPRPELPEIVGEYGPEERKRFAVPPGMTGWWQVEGRSDRPLALHVEDDLYYLRNYSLVLDLQIMFRTLGAVLRGKGAY